MTTRGDGLAGKADSPSCAPGVQNPTTNVDDVYLAADRIHVRHPDWQLGTCAECGEPMVVIEAGVGVHPTCVSGVAR